MFMSRISGVTGVTGAKARFEDFRELSTSPPFVGPEERVRQGVYLGAGACSSARRRPPSLRRGAWAQRPPVAARRGSRRGELAESAHHAEEAGGVAPARPLALPSVQRQAPAACSSGCEFATTSWPSRQTITPPMAAETTYRHFAAIEAASSKVITPGPSWLCR